MINLFSQSRQQLFNRWAATYDYIWPSAFYQAVHKRLLDYVHLPNSATVLDIGCGTGRLLDRLATQYPDLQGIGIDYSPQMLDQAIRRNRYPSRLTYCQGNAEALPVADEQFDAVFNTISFLHYSNPKQVLAEIKRVLRTGGEFYLADYSVRWATEPQIYGVSPDTDIRLYSPSVRQDLGEQAGLSLITHHYLLGPILLSVFRKLG